jgi:hypothetical protein
LSKQHAKTAEIRAFILANLETHPGDITSITSAQFQISKQAVRKHLKALINDRLLVATGATRDRLYALRTLDDFDLQIPIRSDLSEDTLWRQNIRPRMDDIPSNVIAICQYGFTEMVNNVIDHSDGSNLNLQYRRTAASLELVIGDDGIGIFKKISTALGLDDQIHVILELAKGKLTTDPARHTGEGIFFTSRAFDQFTILSDNLVFTHTESGDDWLLENQETRVHGTLVSLKISGASTRKIKDVFDAYASGEDFGFSRTQIPVTLARYGDENLVSRSQAKRLLSRFDRFETIVLDFNGVEMIGQAFGDELFRVFRNDHPGVNLTYTHANQQVEKMILRALAA